MKIASAVIVSLVGATLTFLLFKHSIGPYFAGLIVGITVAGILTPRNA